MSYLAWIHEEDGNFGASFPDLPGVIATAKSLDVLLQRAREALALHLEALSDPPPPSHVRALAADLRDGFWGVALIGP